MEQNEIIEIEMNMPRSIPLTTTIACGEMVLEIEKWDSRSKREVQERAPALFVYRLPSWQLSRVGIGFVIHGLKWR